MVNFSLNELDEYLLIDFALIFLMITYNFSLSTIYFAILILGTIMYYAIGDQRLFNIIPMVKKGGSIWSKLLVGVGFGVAAIWFANYMSASNLFAATAFGDSKGMGMIVFTLIGLIETRFFFRTFMEFIAWKANISTKVMSFSAIIIVAVMAGIFTLFHATAYGLEANKDFMVAFIFAAVSILIIIYFQEAIQAAIGHMVYNGYQTGLFDFITNGTLVSMPVLVVGGIVLLLVFNKDKWKIPFIS